MTAPPTLPDYVQLVCPPHADALTSCDCFCTCSATRNTHHESTCVLLFPEAPRVVIHKESA